MNVEMCGNKECPASVQLKEAQQTGRCGHIENECYRTLTLCKSKKEDGTCPEIEESRIATMKWHAWREGWQIYGSTADRLRGY